MFDDFDTMIQSDEIIPEEYENWMRWVYENGSSFTETE
jgi:L-rhamnose isomerase